MILQAICRQLALINLIILSGLSFLMAQDFPPSEREISSNGVELELGDQDDFSGFSAFDSLATRNRFIFTGEDHRMETYNTVLSTKIMRYLSSRHGYRFMFIEGGEATAWVINRYIVDQDSSADQIIRATFNPNFARSYRWLKEYNVDLPDSLKIRVVGLDVERFTPIALRALLHHLPGSQAPDSIEASLESIRMLSANYESAYDLTDLSPTDLDDLYNFKNNQLDWIDVTYPDYFDSYELLPSIKLILADYESKKSLYRTYLGLNFDSFDRYMKELRTGVTWSEYKNSSLPQAKVFRELYMESRIRKFMEEHPGAKGYGQFGRCHVSRSTRMDDCGVAYFSSLNKRIIHRIPELRDSLASIAIFYGGMEGSTDFIANGNIVDIMNSSNPRSTVLYVGLNKYADTELSGRYSHVIIAKSNSARRIRSGGRSDQGTRVSNEKAGFQFYSYLNRLDYSSLNNKVGSNFSNEQPWFEFSTSFVVDRVVMDFNYGFMPELNSNLGDSAWFRLSSTNFGYRLGYDWIPAPRWELSSTIGFSYLQMKYSEKQESVRFSLSEEYIVQYTNPAFLLNPRINLGYETRYVDLFLMTGYQFDLSSPRWMVDGNTIEDGPESRWNAFQLGAGIRVNLLY